MADFVYIDQVGITIVTNKVTSLLNLQTIEKYIKNANLINVAEVNVPCLFQSKLYLKIIGISYLLENTNTPILTNIVESIIKNNHIFNNIMIASKLHIIKVLQKSDMAIIWLDIWNVQNDSNTRGLTRSGIMQYFLVAQESKCIKYNGPHKTNNSLGAARLTSKSTH